MRKYIFTAAILCSLTASAQLKTENNVPFTIGESRTIASKVLNENRTLNIYLPNDFDKNKSYSVIYLPDGSKNEDFLHIVGLVQFFNMSLNMPDFIVVGIANVDRKRDFTFPTTNQADKKQYPTTGSSEKFISFLETELQPYIDANFKTTGTKYLIGQSLGGLLAIEILIKKPGLFTHYFIVSPSLWWDDESLLKVAETNFPKNDYSKTYVYLSVGSEGKVMENDAKSLVELLSKAKIKTDFVPLPKENHATILHESVYQAFKIQFPYKP